jgi:hypothetical protein
MLRCELFCQFSLKMGLRLNTCCAGDTKRLQELEVKMMGSCSAPSGFAFMSLPGERRRGGGLRVWACLFAFAVACANSGLCMLMRGLRHASHLLALNTMLLPSLLSACGCSLCTGISPAAARAGAAATAAVTSSR